MKKALFLAFMLVAAAAWAADVKLAWDPAPADQQWTHVRIYELNGVNYTKVGEAAGTATEITLTGVQPGKHVYIARSVNQWGESVDSNQAVTPNLNTPPGNLKWSIVITVP